MTPFDPEGTFTLEAVSLLESAAGIPVMTTLSDYIRFIQNILGLSFSFSIDLNRVLNDWISIHSRLYPSWRNLLLIIRLLHEDELAQRMETYLSAGATEELSPTRGKQGILGDEEVNEQIRLRDDEISQLKQQMAIQMQRIGDLEHILSQNLLTIKEQGMSIVPKVASAYLFGVMCMHNNVCVYRR